MSYPTCATCTHWKPVEPGSLVGTPEEVAIYNQGGICQSEKLDEDYYHSTDMLVYSYAEGGKFWTGPHFGCIHHKEGDSK